MNRKQDVIDGLIDGLRSAKSFAERNGNSDAYHYLAGYVTTVVENSSISDKHAMINKILIATDSAYGYANEFGDGAAFHYLIGYIYNLIDIYV